MGIGPLPAASAARGAGRPLSGMGGRRLKTM